MERFYRGNQVPGSDHQTDIELRSALRNHAGLDFAQRRKDARGDLRAAANIFTHQTHDGVIFFNGDVGETFDLRANRLQLAAVCCRR